MIESSDFSICGGAGGRQEVLRVIDGFRRVFKALVEAAKVF